MKVTVHGPLAGVYHDGTIQSWGPDQEVEVADDDKEAVAFYRRYVNDGLAEVIEDVKPEEPPKPPAPKEPPKRR